MTLPVVIAEINFDAAPAVTTSFHLDDPVYGVLDTSTLGQADNWVNVSQWLLEFGCRRGVNEGNAPILRYEAGTGAARLSNVDRRFDPANLAGPYVSAGLTQVEPMRIFRLRAIWAGVVYNIFVGYIDWKFGYDGPTFAAAGIDLTDGFTLLTNPRVASSAVGVGELSGARVNRILNSAAWVGGRNVAAGKTTLAATTLADDPLAELQLVTDTEIGECYVDGDGTVVFRDRHAILIETRSAVPQATFGSNSAAGELPYVSVGIEYLRPVATEVRAAREGGALQTATSVARYPQVYERFDLLMETNAVANDWANWILGMSKDPEYRFSSLTVDPRAKPDVLYPQVLGRRIGDRITIVRRPPGGGTPTTRDVFIRGIEHTLTKQSWVTTWTLQSATKYAVFVLDNASYGTLDNNRLAF